MSHTGSCSGYESFACLLPVSLGKKVSDHTGRRQVALSTSASQSLSRLMVSPISLDCGCKLHLIETILLLPETITSHVHTFKTVARTPIRQATMLWLYGSRTPAAGFMTWRPGADYCIRSNTTHAWVRLFGTQLTPAVPSEPSSVCNHVNNDTKHFPLKQPVLERRRDSVKLMPT